MLWFSTRISSFTRIGNEEEEKKPIGLSHLSFKLFLFQYVFFIILVMGGELVVAMYTVLLGDEWDTRLPNTLKRRLLTYNYTSPQRFEYDLDIVQKQVRRNKTKRNVEVS